MYEGAPVDPRGDADDGRCGGCGRNCRLDAPLCDVGRAMARDFGFAPRFFPHEPGEAERGVSASSARQEAGRGGGEPAGQMTLDFEGF